MSASVSMSEKLSEEVLLAQRKYEHHCLPES
jgi:hypothetical protein